MRTILVDPFLVDGSGHCLPYFRCLQQELRSVSDECEIVGNATADPELVKQGIVAHFSPKFVGRRDRYSLRRIVRSLQSRGHFWDDLVRLTRRFKLGHEDLVIFNSLRPEHLVGLADWILALPRADVPWIVVINHFTVHQAEEVSGAVLGGIRQSWSSLSGAGLARRVVLCADTEHLTEEVRELTNCPVLLLPVPHTHADDRLEPRRAPVHIGYVGEARPDKGFDQLPGLAASLSPLIARGELLMSVQCSIPRHLDRSYAEEIDSLKRSGCRLFEASLSDDEYSKFIKTLDIVLLPYVGVHYRRQTSGVFVEARCAGKIVVAPSGTWMAEKIEENSGSVTFSTGDNDGLLIAVRYVLENFSGLAIAAQLSAKYWRGEHNVRHLVELLLRELSSRGADVTVFG